MKNNKEIRVRCWIDINGVKFFGPGPAELLELIEKSGSIAHAAKIMGMSYKKAWDMMEDMNTRGKKPYVVAHKGGLNGGRTVLTTTGKKVLAAYRELTRRIDNVVQKEKGFLKLI